MNELSLEQKFEYRNWKDAVDVMSRVQIVDELKNAEKLKMHKSNVLKVFMFNLPLNNDNLKLTTEQEFNYALRIKEFEGMNKKVAGETLLSFLPQLIDIDNKIKLLMKKQLFA